jgi:hypothetical protein
LRSPDASDEWAADEVIVVDLATMMTGPWVSGVLGADGAALPEWVKS